MACRDTPIHTDVDLAAIARLTEGFSGAQLDKVWIVAVVCGLFTDSNSVRYVEKPH